MPMSKESCLQRVVPSQNGCSENSIKHSREHPQHCPCFIKPTAIPELESIKFSLVRINQICKQLTFGAPEAHLRPY